MAKFKVHARVLDLLGSEQIADMPTAVSELFKNAYDAYADNVVLELFRHNDHAILWDDGLGMSYEDIENKWLVIGTPGKKLSNPTVRREYEKRPVMGEKGIGRLAISTLGDTLLLISKTANEQTDSFSALFINWKVVRNHDLMLDDFEIPIIQFSTIKEFTDEIFHLLLEEFTNQLNISSKQGKWNNFNELLSEIRNDVTLFKPDLSLFQRSGAFSKESGTAFYIANITNEVNCLASAKNKYDNIDTTVYDQIVLLLSNYSVSQIASSDNKAVKGSIEAFFVDVRIWDRNLVAPISIFNDKKIFHKDDLDIYDHYFDIHFDKNGRYSGTALRYGEQLDLPKPEQQPITHTSKCGPFNLKFWYWQGEKDKTLLDEETRSRIKKILLYSGGLMIYREGLRVMPYGLPDFDWLKFEEKRSKSAGYYHFSYRRMFGYISIDSTSNLNLKDKAGREGLISNAAYRDFRSILQLFFKQMSTQYFYKNLEFRAQQEQIQSDYEKLNKHKKLISTRRQELLKSLNRSLYNIDKHCKTLFDIRDDILNEIETSNLSNKELEKAIDSFEKRIQQLLGRAKVSIPSDLSFGRNKELNQAAFDYKESYKSLQSSASSARAVVYSKLDEDFPLVEKHIARRKLLENAQYSGKMRVGKAFSELNSFFVEQIEALTTRISSARSKALKDIEDVVFEETGISSIDEVIWQNHSLEKIVELIANKAESGENASRQLQEHLSQVFKNALDESNYIILSLQDNRIEELEEKVQQTVELAQIGLSVEMINHDLHKMFRGISGSIKTLKHMFAKIPEAIIQVNSIQSTFQHLELRYRQLEPLYRASQRKKTLITGKNILDFVSQFLAHDLKVVGVDIVPSNKFLEFSIKESPALVFPVFINLFDNANYWLRSVDKRIIRLDVINDIVIINDSGPGIHETMLKRIFEAFTSTKLDGRGLGLYIAEQSLSLANHEIWATNDPVFKIEHGACFCIKFSEKSRNSEKGKLHASNHL